MANFRYQALNDKRQVVSGDLEADTVAQALARLEAQGLEVQSIGYASEAFPTPRAARSAPRPEREPLPTGETPFGLGAEQAQLQAHLANVLTRGQAMAPALRAFAEELPAGKQRSQLSAVLQVLERGDAAEAATSLAALPEYWIPLLSAATAAHDPGRVLHEFLNESQRAADLRRQWQLALAYPLVIAVLAAAVLALLSFLVVPTFRDIFLEFQLSLPRLTILVIQLAEWITSGRVLLVMALAVLAVFLAVGLSKLLPPRVQAWFGDRFGTPLGRTTALARFTQFAADLLEAGLSAPSALRVAGHATRSMRLRRAAWRTAREIERGGAPAMSARREPLTFSVLYVLRADMPPAARVRLLREITRSHSTRAALGVSWTRGLFEPIAIIVVGGLVGTTLLALFMPLFSLVHGLSQ